MAGIMKVKGIRLGKRVYRVRNLTPYTIIITTPEGDIILPPSDVVVYEEVTYVPGKQGYLFIKVKIHGEEHLCRLGNEEIGIVLPGVFSAIREDPDLRKKFEGRIATFPYCGSSIKAWTVVVEKKYLLVL